MVWEDVKRDRLFYIKEIIMDQNKLVIRNVIRIIGIVAGAAAAIAAFIFRAIAASFNTSSGLESLMKSFNSLITACNVARVCAIVFFVLAIAFVVYDAVAKAFPISIGAIGLVIAAVAFVGNFIMAPASSLDALVSYAMLHGDLTVLDIGSYMVIAGGVFYASYHGSCIKKGR